MGLDRCGLLGPGVAGDQRDLTDDGSITRQPIMVSDRDRTYEIRGQLGAALHKLAEKAPTEALRISCLDLAQRCMQPTEKLPDPHAPDFNTSATLNRGPSPIKAIFDFAVQKIAGKSSMIFSKTTKHGSYPSRRRCPSCSGKMIYLASKRGRLHTRTCESCGYSDAKVKMIRQI
jgi:hypothetical protein